MLAGGFLASDCSFIVTRDRVDTKVISFSGRNVCAWPLYHFHYGDLLHGLDVMLCAHAQEMTFFILCSTLQALTSG